MTKQLKLSALIAAMLISIGAYAQERGYVIDKETDNVVRNNYGECWRTDYDDLHRTDCDPKIEDPKSPEYKRVKVSISAEVLFDFDKATLRETARDQLDPLATKLRQDSELRGVVVEGHTDPIGTVQYNQSLSERRANAVMNYLVNAGVPSEKLSAVGKGKSEPSGQTEQCKGRKFRNKVERNACYQPDRRVVLDIESVKIEEYQGSGTTNTK